MTEKKGRGDSGTRAQEKRGRGESARGERGRGGRHRSPRETAGAGAPKTAGSASAKSKTAANSKTAARSKTPANTKTPAASRAGAKAKSVSGQVARDPVAQDPVARDQVARDPVLELDNFLPYRLSVLNNMVSRALAEQYQARFGLSIPEWRVMANLGRAAPMSANEVAERTSMDKVKVSRAISRMQTAGLLKRETDPRDHRVSSLKLSAKGKRIYDKIAPMALAWEQEFLSVLSEREIAAFDKILGKLDKRIRS